jgi:N-acetylmuramoyl-L-alanine amidase
MKPDTIILHHSLTKDSDTVSWGAIRNFHKGPENNWPDIGYHFGIEDMRGQTEIVIGRMIDKAGAHCRGHNSASIGICFIGNFDIIQPPMESWIVGLKLVRFLMRQYSIKTIKGHNELDPDKSCPGRLFDLDKFRNEVM